MTATLVPTRTARHRLLAAALAGTLVCSTVAGCSTTGGTAGAVSTTPTAATSASDVDTSSDTGIFDSSKVHSISIDVDPDAYQAMIDTYVATGDKEWISATVTINGTVFTDVGIKLKGNSSLMGLRGQGPGAGGTESTAGDTTTADPATPESTVDGPAAADDTGDLVSPGRGGSGPGGSVSAEEPEGLPWRIRLDKFVEGQNYQGETDIVVRANNSETSLNEAVALELIGAAGMPTQAASAIRFSVNGSGERLRLLVENPDDDWYGETVGATGILYKAEAGGDYSYRGDDPAEYTDVFEVEANTSSQTENEYAPLIAFLKWLGESDDATFAAELNQWLDIDSFADYLAIQDLVANMDDIDGPGNNSYLSYDEATGLFAIISWDHNLAFGGLGGMAGGGGQTRTLHEAELPENADSPEGFQPPEVMRLRYAMQPPTGGGQQGGGFGLGGNVLSEKFLANEQFAALVEQAKSDLQSELYDGGTAQQILDTWTGVLTRHASDLVSADTIASESSKIAGFFTS